MKTLATFQDFIEANIAADYLRQNGIECFVADQGISSARIVPAAEVRIMIAEEDQEQALILLKNMQEDK